MASKIGRLNPSKTILLVCDMQEKLAKSITRFNEVTETSGRLIDASKLFKIPNIVTEHYAKGNLNYKKNEFDFNFGHI